MLTSSMLSRGITKFNQLSSENSPVWYDFELGFLVRHCRETYDVTGCMKSLTHRKNAAVKPSLWLSTSCGSAYDCLFHRQLAVTRKPKQRIKIESWGIGLIWLLNPALPYREYGVLMCAIWCIWWISGEEVLSILSSLWYFDLCQSL